MTKTAFEGFPKWAATLAVALVATLMACAPQGTEPQDGAAAPLPAVELDERPMIAAHLEQVPPRRLGEARGERGEALRRGQREQIERQAET